MITSPIPYPLSHLRHLWACVQEVQILEVNKTGTCGFCSCFLTPWLGIIKVIWHMNTHRLAPTKHLDVDRHRRMNKRTDCLALAYVYVPCVSEKNTNFDDLYLHGAPLLQTLQKVIFTFNCTCLFMLSCVIKTWLAADETAALSSADCWWILREPVGSEMSWFSVADVQSDVRWPSCTLTVVFFNDQYCRR